MAEVDVYSLHEERPAPWSRRAPRRHPLLAGMLAVAVAVGAWDGLLAYLRAVREHPAAARPTVIRSADPGPARPSSPRTPPGRSAPAAAGPEPRTARAGSAAIAPVTVRGGGTTTAPAETASAATRPITRVSAAPAPNVSPFLRSHPWAGVPGQRYYYPSQCPATLRLRDLVFFRSEEQARAQGFVRSPPTECQ